MNSLKTVFLILSLGFFSAFAVYGQKTEVLSENTLLNNIIEDFLANNDEIRTDPTILYDQLNEIKKYPININSATVEDWSKLFFIPDNQIRDIISYKNSYGPFLSVYELQAVPSLSITDVRNILPFVQLSGSTFDFHVPILRMFKEGRNDLYVRAERILEESAGYSEERKNSGSSYYLGNRDQYFMRFRHQYANKLTFGFTAEKDPGEQFFTGSNKNGFDYYTVHAFLKNYSSKIIAVALGDYAVSFGQGLIMHSGFSYGKSSFATLIKRGGPVLLPYTSTLENTFFRGVGLTLGINKNLELTTFASRRYIDGNTVAPDSIVEYDFGFSSLQTSGLHRTASEIEDKNSILQRNAGMCLKYKRTNFTLAFNGLYTDFDKIYKPQARIDNVQAFQGKSLINTSVDYSYIYRNFYFFGEIAKADNDAIAAVNGVLIGLDRKVDLAIFHRILPADYHSLNPAVFAEGSSGSNESGFYIGTKIYPAKGWTIDAYMDFWKNPWLRFNVASPSIGNEYLAKVQYSIKRKLDIYVQYRNETKAQNISADENIQKVGNQNKQQIRIHLAHKLNKRLELRNRAEWSFFKAANGVTSNGFLLYQDVIFRPIEFPVSMTARIAYFDTQDYNSRIYTFENALLYSFSIPPFYFKGTRWYLNLRARVSKNVVAEAGIAQTILSNQKTIGSGLDQINGNTKTEVRAQVKFSF